MADVIPVDRPTAIVTDANTRLGETIARTLASNGFHVVLAAADLDQCVELAAAVGGTALQVDVRSDASVRSFATRVSTACVLVISGAVQPINTRIEGDTHDWQWRWEIRTLGTLRMVTALLSHLVDTNGLIVTISAEGSVTPMREADPDQSRYSERTLHRLIAAEVGGLPVHFTRITLAPPESDGNGTGSGTANGAALITASQIPPATAKEIAEVITFAAMKSVSAALFLDEVVIRPRSVPARRIPTGM